MPAERDELVTGVTSAQWIKTLKSNTGSLIYCPSGGSLSRQESNHIVRKEGDKMGLVCILQH